jgi:hypothetical protein
MSARLRRTAALGAIAALLVGSAAGAGGLQRVDAMAAALDLRPDSSTPAVLARPLWSNIATQAPGGHAAARGLQIIRRAQRNGVLRALAGTRPLRLVRIGDLQDRGRSIGVSALLALPVARHHVHARIPVVTGSSAAGPQVSHVQLVAPVLRDVLVDVDLRQNTIVSVEPGPASRTSGWPLRAPATAPAAAVVAAPTSPLLVRLSPGGPSFAPDDGTSTLGPVSRDWPVSLIFSGHATVAKVKRALRTLGFTHSGERRWLAYRDAGGTIRFDGDRGLKTATDANGTDVHLRLYAPAATDHFSDPRFGDVVAASVHLDHGEGSAPGPALFGFSEQAEQRVADAVASKLGWQVQRNRVALGNAEPYRRDLAAPDHLWWNNGRATLISVP